MGKQHKSRDFAARVGARIRFLRLERGLSVRKFAEIAKCCVSNIPVIELGRSSIQMHVVRKIVRALRVEPFDLLNHDPENDDIGYSVEKMPQDPGTRRLVKSSSKRGMRALRSISPCHLECLASMAILVEFRLPD